MTPAVGRRLAGRSRSLGRPRADCLHCVRNLCDDADVAEWRPKRSGQEPAHDILAAEAFAVPAADPSLRHHLVLPEDPAGTPEPHDILAAEEFAMPAPGTGAGRHESGHGTATWAKLTGLAGVGLGVLWLRRRRR